MLIRIGITYKISALCFYRVLFMFIVKSVQKREMDKANFDRNIESVS